MEPRSRETAAEVRAAPSLQTSRRSRNSPRAPSRQVALELQVAIEAGAGPDDVLAAVAAAPEDVAPLDALFAAEVIDEESYYQALSRRLGCDYYLGSPRFGEDFDAAKALRSGVAPLAARGRARAVIAPRASVVPGLIEMTAAGRLRPESFAVTSPKRFGALLRAQRSEDLLAHALSRLSPALSARSGLHRGQVAALGVAAALAGALAATSAGVLPAVGMAVLWTLFLSAVGLRSLAAVANPEERRPRILGDDDLPLYTVVAAVYREEAVVSQLVAALNALDYPKAKLDIKLVVERRDRETLARLLALDLPPRFEVLVAPPGVPSTKPRALNLARMEARGDFLVVYDAEDIPAPDQLRLAASAFAADPDVDCLQARLTVRNVDDGWLTRAFALEYAVLFDLINPGLCALGLPVALGGTSNHFRVSALSGVGGWDEWNVAEDADLGVRLARYGYRVRTLDSETSEEAPNELANWFAQRVRWQKGWMQTCIVHSRDLGGFVGDLGAAKAFAAAILIFGAVASALFWPGFAFATLERALASGEADLSRAREAADVFVYLLALAGVWSIAVPATVVARQRRLRVGAAAFALLPLYYALVSAAAWTAIVDLAIRPHFWAKTRHGRSRRRPDAAVPARRRRSERSPASV